MRGKAIALGSGIVLLLVAGIIGWNLVAVPRRADHLYRQTVELFLEVDIILREGIPSLWRDADSEKIRTTCASLTVAPLSSMGDSVAQLDGLRYTLKGAGKQELAGKFVDAAKRYWRAQKGAIDSWCNNNGLFLVRVRHGERVSKREWFDAAAKFDRELDQAQEYREDMVSVWKALDVLLARK